MENIILFGGGNQAHYTIDIIEKENAIVLHDAKGELEFDNVDFNYHVDESKLLKDVKRYGRMEDVGAVLSLSAKSNGKKKDEDKGFMSKLMFWRGSSSDKPSQAQYRIHLKSEGESTTVQVLTREGGVDRSDTSKRILGLLYEQLK